MDTIRTFTDSMCDLAITLYILLRPFGKLLCFCLRSCLHAIIFLGNACMATIGALIALPAVLVYLFWAPAIFVIETAIGYAKGLIGFLGEIEQACSIKSRSFCM